MSDFILPQLAIAAQAVPRGPNWRCELKIDGYRAQVHLRDGDARIFTRNGHDWTARFGRLAERLRGLTRESLILDGEIAALDQSGRPDFTRLCGRLDGAGEVAFYAFDLLAIGREGITHRPLVDRRARLEALFPQYRHGIRLVEQVESGHDLLDWARTRGWEGIVAKDITSSYRSGERAPGWRKVKCKNRQEFIVMGWRPDPVTGALKSLVLATLDNNVLVHRGSVGTGLTATQRDSIAACLANDTLTSEPVRISGYPAFYQVQPRLIVEVEYLQLSSHGIIRQPVFLGLREDKPLADVQVERAG